MKIKLFEEFHIDDDPFGEEIPESEKTFINWLMRTYPNRNKWHEIQHLDCSNMGFTDIDGINHLTNLIEVNLNSNRLKDIGELANNQRIEKLLCRGNELETIDVNNMTNLSWLSLKGNKLKNINGLENLKRLKILNCSDNNLTEIKNLSSLMLDNLYIAGNQFDEKYVNFLERYCEDRDIDWKSAGGGYYQ